MDITSQKPDLIIRFNMYLIDNQLVVDCSGCGAPKRFRSFEKSRARRVEESNPLCRSCKSKDATFLSRRGKAIRKSLQDNLVERARRHDLAKMMQSKGYFFGHLPDDAARKRMNPQGRTYPEAAKQKQRERIAIRMMSLGIAPRIDKGATEYFNQLNEMGYTIYHPNIYVDGLGYFVDGYDPFRHIVFEFDTPVHKYPSKKKEDLHRQSNIINHFKTIGNPLKMFIRINDTGRGEEGMVNVLESK